MAKSRNIFPEHVVISGPMFAGKTRELQRQYTVFKSCQFNVQVFKINIDKRYSEREIITHDGLKFNKDDVFIVRNAEEIKKKLKPETDVIMIDEAQFYGPELVEMIDEWVEAGKIVVSAVLPTDYRGKTFGIAGDLLARADRIIQLFPRCTYQENGVFCHRPATRTFRKTNVKDIIVVGGSEMYEPRCRLHHFVKKELNESQ